LFEQFEDVPGPVHSYFHSQRLIFELAIVFIENKPKLCRLSVNTSLVLFSFQGQMVLIPAGADVFLFYSNLYKLKNTYIII
jgi:hypothetical protein